MNDLSHFSGNDLKSIKTYLEYCRDGLKSNNGNPEQLQDIVEELDEVCEELVKRYGEMED